MQGNDDYGAMYEVLTRRLRRLLEGSPAAELMRREPPAAGASPEPPRRGPSEPRSSWTGAIGGKARFAYPPQLLLLDGGKGQLGVGVRVLEELGLTDKIAVASLAKQLEEVFVPGRPDPVQIPRDSEAIYLLQQARDEAHRFAISFHRELRGRRMTRGALDGVAGLGPARRTPAHLRDRRRAGRAGGLAGRPARARLAAGHRRAGPSTSTCTPGELRRPDEHDRGPLGAHATWWRETFTNGADLEYELQILPLAVSHLDGPGACSTSVAARASSPGDSPQRARAARDRRRAGALGGPARRCLALAAARPRPMAGPYVRGVGERLPFRDGCFDGVVCCLVIEHASDPDALLAEAVRVLAVGGRFLLLVNHPLFQGTGSGFVDDQILGEHYWRVGPYLREDVVLEEVDPGVKLRFAHRPLSRYVNPVTARAACSRASRSPSLRSPSSRARSTWSSSRPSRGSCCSDSSGWTPAGWEDRAGGRVPDPRGPFGSRALDGGRNLRGPRLVRDRQPAACAHRQDRRAHEPGRRGIRARLPRRGARWIRGHRGARARDPRAAGDRCEGAVVFLDAPDDVLVRRYEGTRRRHPVEATSVLSAIQQERRC